MDEASIRERLATLEAVLEQLVNEGKNIVVRIDKLLENDSAKLQRIAKLETRQSIIARVLGTVASLVGTGIIAALIALLV